MTTTTGTTTVMPSDRRVSDQLVPGDLLPDPADDRSFIIDRSTDPGYRDDRGSHLVFHRNPIRMFFSAGPWAATAYLGSYLVVGPALFAVALTVGSIAYALSITWIGLPLLIGAAVLVRGGAQLERGRAQLVGAQIASHYRPIRRAGFFAQIKERWGDPGTLRDYIYLTVMFIPLLVLDALAFSIWLAFVGMITVPLWFWSIPQDFDGAAESHGVMIGYTTGPYNRYGDGAFGFWIGDLSSALLAAAAFLVLSVLAAYLVVAVARVHLAVARNLLRPYVDPLADAKRMLAAPGPLVP